MFLTKTGHVVIHPKLDDDDFDAAVKTAQAEFDEHQPDVIVGSSRGCTVATSIGESMKAMQQEPCVDPCAI